MDGVLFFEGVAALREWIDSRGGTAGAWLGFDRVRYGTGPAGLRFQPAADLLAEIGWVEGERRALDDGRYAVRFAPGEVKRRRAPAWSLADGPVEMPVLSPEYEERFRADAEAWAFFEKQPPRYRRAAIWWVMSGKAEQTRQRRLDALVEGSAAGEKLAQLTRQL